MPEQSLLGGPVFEAAKTEGCHSLFNKDGAHYNIFVLDSHVGMEFLREMFPEGEGDELNFVLFSTSGVHGSYATIEEIEESLRKWGEIDEGNLPEGYEAHPSNYVFPYLTVLIVHPRLVCLRYGDIRVTLEDIPFLKRLRESSMRAIGAVGRQQ